jgi:hypothetical protein
MTEDNIQNWLEAYDEVIAESNQHRPEIMDVLAKHGPLPQDALFLGTVEDGQPLLLSLYDTAPGPLLVASDGGRGAIAFLEHLVASTSILQRPESVQICIITKDPEEWELFGQFENVVAIFSIHSQAAEDMILSLAAWAHDNKTSRQSVILIVDSLSEVNKLSFEARQNFLWLLLRGVARHVWPFVAVDAKDYENVLPWVGSFRTRIFGTIEDQEAGFALGIDNFDLRGFGPQDFLIREANHWLRFKISNL